HFERESVGGLRAGHRRLRVTQVCYDGVSLLAMAAFGDQRRIQKAPRQHGSCDPEGVDRLILDLQRIGYSVLGHHNTSKASTWLARPAAISPKTRAKRSTALTHAWIACEEASDSA